MKYNTGNWVIITRHRLDGPDVEMVGKVVEATRDYVVAESWKRIDGERKAIRTVLSEDTATIVSFRRMSQRDWNRRGH